MGCFFLHKWTVQTLSELHPGLYPRSDSSPQGTLYRQSGLNDFGWRGKIYEVAEVGGMGKVPEVEQSGLYDFLDYLSYQHAKGKYEQLKERARKRKGKKAGR